MNTPNQEPTLVCEECGETFPAEEIKYDWYFERYVCLGCRRKLAALRDVHRIRIFIEIQFIAWAVGWGVTLLLIIGIILLR